MPGVPPSTEGRRQDVTVGLVLMALSAAIFLSSVGHEFVADDLPIIVSRPGLLRLDNWAEILSAPWWQAALYRPLTRLTFAVDWSVGAGSPHVFHGVNVFWHAMATGLVYAVGRRWLSVAGAAVATLLFAVHPVHVEAVASVVGRAEVLATVFVLAAVLLYRWDGELATRADFTWRRYVSSLGTLAAVLAGVASKESALAAPGILLVVDWIEARRAGEPFGSRVRGHYVLWLATVALAVEWLLIRGLVLGELAGDRAAPGLLGQGMGGRVLIMAPVVIEYVRLLALPWRLSADYSPDFLSAQPAVTARVFVGIGLILAGVVFAWKARDRAPLLTAGLAWTGGTLLVVSNLIVPSGVLLAERSMYLPSVGVVVALGFAAQWAMQRRRAATLAVTGMVAFLWGVRTTTRIPVWKDASTFLPALVADAPRSFRSQWAESSLRYDAGDREAGERLLRESLRTYPLFPNTWQELGARMQQEGRWREAAGAFSITFKLDPKRVVTAALAVDNYTRAGMLDSALVIATQAHAVDPDQVTLLRTMGNLAEAAHDPLRAMTYRRRVAWLDPETPANWYWTARSALDAGYCPEAERSLRELEALHHSTPEVDTLRRRSVEAGCAA